MALDRETVELAALFADEVMKRKRRTADRAPAVLAVLAVVLEHPHLLEPGHGAEVRRLAGIRRDDCYWALGALRGLVAAVSARALAEGRVLPLALPNGDAAVPDPGDDRFEVDACESEEES